MDKYKCIKKEFDNFNVGNLYDSPFRNSLYDYYGRILHFSEYTFKECFQMVTETKTYYFDEILKMIREEKLKEDIVLISTSKCATGTINMFGRLSLNEFKEFEPFEIYKEKEYLTFDKARKSNKNFKYKNWNKFYGLLDSLDFLSKNYGIISINKMLDEKSWEVEE